MTGRRATHEKLGAPVRFLIVGIANTVVGLLSIYLLKWLLGFDDAIANILGYMIALALSFVLNRGWTFEHSGPILPAFLRFVCIFAVAYLVNLAIVMASIRVFGVNAYLAHAIGIAPYTVLFYLGSRYFAFRPMPSSHTHG